MLPIDKWFPHGYISILSSDQSISDALRYSVSNTRRITGTGFKTIGKVKEIDLPVWVEFEGDTRAAEDPADCVCRLDFEFVLLLGWWVTDRN